MAIVGKKLVVAFPDTVLEERESLRDKTAKLGLIARACSIYGVDLIEVFRDEKGKGQPALIRKVLEYLETPQYLRRRLYSMDESLKFAGVLPPLRIPSHRSKTPLDKVAIGEIREGVTNADGTVDVGLDRNPRLTEKVQPNKRVTVKVASLSPLRVELAGKNSVNEYWGYAVETKGVQEVFEKAPFEVKIATSRFGSSLASSVDGLRASVREASSLKLVFGSPRRGLFELLGPDLVKKSDFVINLFGAQQVETVRTEEALFAGLGLVNYLVS